MSEIHEELKAIYQKKHQERTNEIVQAFKKRTPKATQGTDAWEHSARANGRSMALEEQVFKLFEQIEDLKRQLARLTGRTDKHIAHLRAHRARIDGLETRASTRADTDQQRGLTVAKSAGAQPRQGVIPSNQDSAQQILEDADALPFSPYYHVEQLVRAGKLEEARALVDSALNEIRGAQLLTRARALKNLPGDAHRQLLEGLDAGHHDVAEQLITHFEAKQKAGR